MILKILYYILAQRCSVSPSSVDASDFEELNPEVSQGQGCYFYGKCN